MKSTYLVPQCTNVPVIVSNICFVSYDKDTAPGGEQTPEQVAPARKLYV